MEVKEEEKKDNKKEEKIFPNLSKESDEIIHSTDLEEKEGSQKLNQLNQTDNSNKVSKQKKINLNYFKGKIISFLSNKYNLIFLVILLLAFLIRMKYIGQASMWNDAAVHLWYVIKVTKEPLFMFSQQYILGDYFVPQTIMAFFYLFTKNAFLAGKIVAIVYSIIGIIFMYLLGSKLKNKLTGVIAAALLAFNHMFWFYGVRPLADSPLLVTTIILLYCMVQLEKTKKVSWGIASGIMFLAAMFTKVQSIIFIFALLIYYLIFKRKIMLKNKEILFSWGIPVGFILIAHILAKILFGVALLNRVFNLFLTTRGMPYGLEALGMIKWIFSWYIIPFVILGLLFVLFYKKKEYYFSIILFLFYWLFFEINVDNTQDRYVLPLLSVGIILAAFAIEEIGNYIKLFSHKYLKLIVIFGIVLLVCWNYYQVGNPLIYNKSFSYVGHQEAGEWMKVNIPKEAPIFAGSYRYVRLFSEREFGGPGDSIKGTIWNLRSPDRYAENQTAFEEDLARLSKESDVYLEIDRWEYTQPSWYYPITEATFDYFVSLGFELVYVAQPEVITNDGLQQVPMIFIFKKNKVGNS